METTAIDQTKKSNREYLATLTEDAINFPLYMQLRECEVGEAFSKAGKCTPCAQDTEYSVQKFTEPADCEQCPSIRAQCNGGSDVGPKKGYWRSSAESDDFILCLFFGACTGMNPDGTSPPTGSCAEGYQGILCADCKVGFSRSGSFECGLCPKPLTNILRLAAIFIFVVAVVIMLIKTTLSGAVQRKNVTSIYTKILMNHL